MIYLIFDEDGAASKLIYLSSSDSKVFDFSSSYKIYDEDDASKVLDFFFLSMRTRTMTVTMMMMVMMRKEFDWHLE